ARLVRVSAPGPALVSVTLCGALVVFVVCVPKVSVPGDSVTTGGGGATPVPLKATVCGLPLPLSVRVSVAVRAPVPAGVKVTLIVHAALAGSVAGLSGQVVVTANSLALGPVTARLVRVSAPGPALVSVTLCGALVVFVVCVPKVSVPGDSVTTGGGGATPVPLKATVCGLPLPLSVRVSVAVRAPV